MVMVGGQAVAEGDTRRLLAPTVRKVIYNTPMENMHAPVLGERCSSQQGSRATCTATARALACFHSAFSVSANCPACPRVFLDTCDAVLFQALHTRTTRMALQRGFETTEQGMWRTHSSISESYADYSCLEAVWKISP